ncbi:hypothetical protein ACERK3_16720 [Phycisphaerales bacterium AB-hyl4]|uniref:Uncharacterized protein n=1 Tax=Natronomicrosphaera hydrolytica TaxID=3242702 RepID=A0ABV4U8K2_9BACT
MHALTPELINTLAQAGGGGRIDVALQVGAGGVLVAIIWGVVAWYRRRGRTQRFDAFVQQPGFEPINDQKQLETLSESIGDVFGDMSMYARQLTIRGALHYPSEEFDVKVVHVVLGFEASNAQHHTMEKVVVLVSGFKHPLPRFRVMPNNFLFRHIHRNKIFDANTKFGEHNLVLGRDREHINALFTPDVQQPLQENRSMVIEARRDLLAFFLHDERVEPDDLGAFVADCLSLAALIRKNAADMSATPAQS